MDLQWSGTSWGLQIVTAANVGDVGSTPRLLSIWIIPLIGACRLSSESPIFLSSNFGTRFRHTDTVENQCRTNLPWKKVSRMISRLCSVKGEKWLRGDSLISAPLTPWRCPPWRNYCGRSREYFSHHVSKASQHTGDNNQEFFGWGSSRLIRILLSSACTGTPGFDDEA